MKGSLFHSLITVKVEISNVISGVTVTIKASFLLGTFVKLIKRSATISSTLKYDTL